MEDIKDEEAADRARESGEDPILNMGSRKGSLVRLLGELKVPLPPPLAVDKSFANCNTASVDCPCPFPSVGFASVFASDN